VLQARGSSNLWSMVNWVTCLREHCVTVSVFTGRNFNVLQNRPLKWKEAYCSSCKTMINVRSKTSSTLLSIVNWVTCWREYCLTLSVFMGEDPQVFAKLPLSSQGNQPSNSWKRSRNVRNRRVKHLVSQAELIYFFQGIMPTTQCVHGWGIPPLCNITP
jgi:hypothetical protein